ncbi:N-acetylmuramoyl-L-alanine amidase [Bacillus massilinigeriensis]|uniref:N-acetylmuramoyl-L-alanine amidase n=1 Tax=Bacillus massilionigeriensis TaxID=1805475 RepID=UPI00096B0BF0|nr:N-acetylmuramoyl-L-alanine amidase [Bacillus massilionigeriensis]
MVKIFLDPGHGGTDPGAVGNGLQEKNVTLQIALKIRNILSDEYENVSIKMSRTKDETVSLNQRTNEANSWGADFFLSIHINSGNAVGFESFVYPNVGRPTTSYQEEIHEAVIDATSFNNRGRKQADFHVLRESNMDAVLTENGFITTKSDSEKLKSSAFIERIARGHVNGLAKAFNLKRKKGSGEPRKVAKPPLYRVIVGSTKESTKRDTLVKKAEDKGFKTYVFQKDGLFHVQIGAFKEKENAEDLMRKAQKAGLEAKITL